MSRSRSRSSSPAPHGTRLRRSIASPPPPASAALRAGGATHTTFVSAAPLSHRYVPSEPAAVPPIHRTPRRLPPTLLPAPPRVSSAPTAASPLQRTPRRLPPTLLPSPPRQRAHGSRTFPASRRSYRVCRTRRPGEVFAWRVKAKLHVSVCDPGAAAGRGWPPGRIWVTHESTSRRVNTFVVANGLTYIFSTFADRFRVSECAPGVFTAAVSCAAVAKLLRHRAAFIFAGVLFRILDACPTLPQQSEIQKSSCETFFFGSLTFAADLGPFPYPSIAGSRDHAPADRCVPVAATPGADRCELSSRLAASQPSVRPAVVSTGCCARSTPAGPGAAQSGPSSLSVTNRTWAEVAKTPPAGPQSASPRPSPLRYRSRPFSPAGLCYRCLSPIHCVRDCRDPLKCRLCKRSGHRAKGCPDRFDLCFSAPPAPMASRPLHHHTTPPALSNSTKSLFDLGDSSSDDSTDIDKAVVDDTAVAVSMLTLKEAAVTEASASAAMTVLPASPPARVAPAALPESSVAQPTDAAVAAPVPAPAVQRRRRARACPLEPVRASARIRGKAPALCKSVLDMAVELKAAKMGGEDAPQVVPPPLSRLEIKSMSSSCQLPDAAVRELEAALMLSSTVPHE
ncbi:hypothetical protein ACQ4PT_044324 [Festuca glaucescens]